MHNLFSLFNLRGTLLFMIRKKDHPIFTVYYTILTFMYITYIHSYIKFMYMIDLVE